MRLWAAPSGGASSPGAAGGRDKVRRRGVREGRQVEAARVAAGLCATRGAAEVVPRGGMMSLGAGNSGGGAKPRREAAAPCFSGQRKKKEIQGWFCNYQNLRDQTVK